EVKASAIGNLKLADTLALRVAYSQTTRDGIIDNIYRNEEVNERDSKGVRARLLWEPTARLDVNLIGEWNESKQLCCAWTVRTAPPGTPYANLTASAGIIPGPRNLQIAADEKFFQDLENRGASLQLDYDAGWGTLTS